MTSPATRAKIERLYTAASEISARLDTIPPNQRATVVRGLLLSNCLEVRGVIARGTTHAYGIPAADILRQAQLLLLAYRQMRSSKLH